MHTLIVALCMPPASLVTAALLGNILSFKWRLLGTALSTLSLLLLMALSLPFVAGLLIRSLEMTIPTAANASPKAIVILSGDVERTADSTDELDHNVVLGQLTRERLDTGATIARNTRLPIMVSGGTIFPNEASLAGLMATRLAQDYGLEVRWVESKSGDTWENAKYSADILKSVGIDQILLVTHAWHMRRGIIAFEHFGIKSVAAPTPLNHVPRLRLNQELPSVKAWQSSYFALHEWIGIVDYSFKAWLD